MPIDIPNALRTDFASLEQEALLDLYEIDLSGIVGRDGVTTGKVYYLHAGLNFKKQNVVWKGQEYTAFPIKGSEFEQTVQGTSPRPKLALSNLFGFVTGLINDFGECLGVKVTRRQVYAKYLDPVNFIDGRNPKHNRNNEVVTHFVIEQLEQLSNEVASFSLALPTELDNLLLPARAMMADTCTWVYRSVECGYTGTEMFTDKDQPTIDRNLDRCSKCLNGCKIRGNQRNFGAFIAINKL